MTAARRWLVATLAFALFAAGVIALGLATSTDAWTTAGIISDDARDVVMRRLNDGRSTYSFSWTSEPHEAEQ